ncbi:hypothetical protein PCANC_03784 [Puccinia coronata f. sp. avenae]|uniref:Uncharacterized protein n=1 Tax=Puccinia coronata f. sp. avenae TaxID=200324 RepID=A0A2N5VV85_9BASI|nr:hypothetical protein PCANC_03784 [Puccinia coronata f. sp. avenae]
MPGQQAQPCQPQPQNSGRQGNHSRQATTVNGPLRRVGERAPGAQGYKPNDCKALVAAANKILPLGSQEWGKDNLKTKFKALVDAKKPTGETVCKPWIRDAKSVIDLGLMPLLFRNGVGAPIPMSPIRIEDEITISQEVGQSGWPATQTPNQSNQFSARQENALPGPKTLAADLESVGPSPLIEPGSQSAQVPVCAHATLPSNLSSQRPIRPCSDSTNVTPGRPNKHPRQNIQSDPSRIFNSEERDKREKEQNLAQLYQLQLQEAHSTIHRLEEEVSRLRDGITLQVARLQDQNTQLQKDLSDAWKDYGAVKRELTQQTVKNSNLENKLELMQLCMDLKPGANLGMMNHHPRPSTSGLNNDV